MLAGDLADQTPDATIPPQPVLRWLAKQGWHDNSDDGLVCAQHPGEGRPDPR
jgi:hypothetical protein